MKQESSSAIRIKRGNVTVRIYRNVRPDGTYYLVADYSSGKRRLISFSDLKQAKVQAELIAARTATGDQDVLELRSADRAAYLRATQLLQSLGTPLESAVAQFVDASRILGKTSLVEAARFYAKKHPSSVIKMPVAGVVAEFLADKQAKGKSERYVSDLKYRCQRFADHFKCGIAEITTRQSEEFLASLGLSQQSYVNFRRVLGTLFAFAKRRGYVAKDFDEIEQIERIQPKTGDIEIYTPEEFARLLSAAADQFLPALVIGGFAGLRSSEIERLDWSEVRVAERFIEVKKAKTKTASRRLVPISDNLAAWLSPLSKQGPIWPEGHDAFYDAQQRTAAATATADVPAVKWKQNGLRHSYISYRLALIQNEHQVALECGNSPAMIHKHYKQLVTPAAAASWFGIFPKSQTSPIIPSQTRSARGTEPAQISQNAFPLEKD